MKSKFLLLALILFCSASLPATAQLSWSSYNTSGNRVSASAATYDSATGTYTFTIPASTTYTFVTTNIAPVTLAASQTKTVTFAMNASGGFGPAGTPIVNQRFIAYGLFNYGATAPGATGAFTDDVGLWTDSYQQASGIAAEVFGGTSTTANLLGYANTRQLGAATGPSTGAAGQFTNGSTTNVTFRVVENASGTASIGTGTGTTVSGAWYQDAATSGTTFNRTIYSGGATTPSGTTTFNEFAFMFFNSTGSSVTLTLSNITGVTPPPIITAQPPATTSATTASNLTISVTATGATSYQWRKSTDGGTTFTAISGNATATTASLTLSNVTSTDAGVYNVVVTNAAGSVTSTSDTVTITAGTTPPSISTQPASATVLVGAGAGFTVAASGTTPMTFQWAKSTDGGVTYTNISGATSATYSISSVALTDAGSYRATATNVAGSATSNAAVLTVQQVPAITTQPVAATVAAGGSYTLSVAASGTPAPTYQWKLNGTNISGATSANYTISSAGGANAGYYSCVATNAAGTATSSSVYVGVLSSTMSLSSVTPGGGATGKNRDVLLKITLNQAVSVGNAGRIRVYDASSPATPVDTIDMSTAVSVTQFGTTYRYMAKTIGGVNFNYLPVTASGSTATIALHSSTVLSYGKTYYVNIEPGVLLDASGATLGGISDSSTWSFSTKAGGLAASAASISVAADGSGDFDTVQGAVDFVPFSPTNTIARTITIANGTYNEIIRLRSGQNLVTMQGQSKAGAVIQYLTNNNTLISGANSIGQRSVFGADPNDFTIQNLTIRNSTPHLGSQAEAFWVGNNAQRMTIYNLNILSFQDTVMSNGGQAFFTDCYVEGDVDFIWGSGKTFFQNSELKMMTSGGFYVQARNSPSTFPGYFFSNCQLTSDAGVAANSSYLARIDPGVSGGYPYSQVVWMNCRMGTHIISSGWQLNNASTAPNVKYWEYQSTDLAGTTPTTVTGRPTYNNNATGVGASAVLANQQIDSATSAYFSNATNAIGWSPVPVIGTQPAGQSVSAGQAVNLSVAATAPLAMTYQWFKGGGAISGATGASYTIGSSLPSDTGSYTVVITDAAGSVTSNAAAVSVTDTTPPVLTLPSNMIVEATSAAGAVASFTPTATDNVGVTSLSATPASGSTFAIGTTTVNVIATDGAGNTANGSFTVTVRDTIAPVVTPPANVTVAATSSSGAVVSYSSASASDAVGVVSFAYSPVNGTTFAIGTTTVTVTARDAANNAGTANFTVTVTPLTRVQSWREQYFGTTANAGSAADSADADGDGITNLMEFGFGTDPTSPASGAPPLQYAGTFAGGGTIAGTGQPIMKFETTVTGVDFRALFVRRVDFAAAGLTYTVQFSADLNSWTSSAAAPTVLADDGTFQIVSVPYLPFVHGKKARFFRVQVSIAP